MKILIISDQKKEVFLNHRLYPLLEYLSKYHYDITLLNRYSRKIKHPSSLNCFSKCLPKIVEETSNSIRYIQIKPFTIPLIHTYTNAYLSALAFHLKYPSPYDICITQSPWPGEVGVWLKKMGSVNFLVYEDLDFFEGFYCNASKHKQQRIRHRERFSLTHSDLVITISNELKKYRMSQTKAPIVQIPNGVNYSLFSSATSIDKPKDRFNLIYIGSLERWAGVDIVIKAMPALVSKHSNIYLQILGAGRYEEKLKRLSSESGATDHIEFLGRKSYQELPQYLAQSHIGIASFEPLELMRYAFTLKIIEYMSAGLPVVATAIGETETIIKDSKAGISINYSIKSFVEAILNLYENHILYENYSLNAKSYAKQLDWATLFDKEFTEIETHLNEKLHTQQKVVTTW